MKTEPNDKVWREIGRYAQTCPSPHNTQPYRLKINGPADAEVVFLPRRGLPVGDPLGRFTWLTAGIFIEICSIAAHSLGFELHVTYHLDPMYPDGDVETPQVIAELKLEASSHKADLDAGLIMKRHTSRLPYDGKPIPQAVILELQQEAEKFGHSFEVRTDRESIRRTIELNKQALFHDLDNDTIRTELIKWLRFDEREALLMRDGLSAKCLHFSGRLLKSFFFHHGFWRFPVVGSIVGVIYKSTMKGIGTIGWLRGDYRTIDDWVRAGHVMIRLWLILTKHGLYWHPYGSVITSESARQNMLKYMKLADEEGGANMVWLLLRMGSSEQPPISERLPLEEVILCGY